MIIFKHSLFIQIDCNVNANYLKYYKTGMALLYATRINDSSQASVVFSLSFHI